MPSRDGRARVPETSLRDVLERDSLPSMRLRFDASDSIYAAGEQDDSIYLVETGQVKVFLSSESGNDCVMAVYSDGDVFGETCFVGSGRRLESAAAMLPTTVRRVIRRDLVTETQMAGAMESLLKHLAARINDRQAAVFDLVTMDAARRLAKLLLQLAEKLGEKDGDYLRFEQRISHEELSQIVGTTRPRITAFMQRFRLLGLIDTTGPRSIRVHKEKTMAYLETE